MLETTLCFSSSPLIPLHKEPLSATSSSSSSSFSPIKFSPVRPRSLRFIAKSAGSSSPGHPDDPYGHYPWESSPDSDSSIQWIREETVTLFTTDGLVKIGGNLVPKRIHKNDKKQEKLRISRRYKESDYMDPNQGLCLGALFDIAATNGLDMGRRLCIFGYCRSIEMLSDVVEDTVLEHGGEVVAAERKMKGGLHEKLTMTVAVPLLWGVPPASETLHLAVRSGGGIVDKVYWQWNFL